MTTTSAVLTGDDFPALYQSASRQSANAQNSFLRWSKVRLISIVVAAAGGLITVKTSHIHIGGAIAFLAFATALAAEIILLTRRPERIWYEGRAAAESAKTLTWRYMVHGEPYTANIDDPDRTFIAELKDILQDLDALPIQVPSGQALQISPKMREIRALPFNDRRDIYLTRRIQNQQKWYADKAEWNKKRADVWTTATVILEILGLIGAGIKAAGLLDVDLLGIFAAAAASATSWLQAKQHQNLATAYGLTSQELALVASGLEAVTDETTWPRFVADAEEAISREHTLWRASRGISGK